MNKLLLRLSVTCCLAMSCLLSAADQPLVWETVSFTFPIKGKDGVKDTAIRVQIPKKEQQNPIRGVIQSNGSFTEVAHQHNMAVFNLYDEGKTRGPSKEFLAAAAKACNRPELEFAGAVVIGCSAGGRQAAQWAGFNKERTIAVFLDHSFASNGPNMTPNYDYGNLPIVPGVPMCFSATHDNTYQNADRREHHYNWCTTAFREHDQPCTTSIYYEPSGHCQVKSRALQAVWLDEVIALRVPATIPADKAYELIPISIHTGGMVKADLSHDDKKRSYHDNVVIGPSPSVTKHKMMNFWLPGPQTAALYAEWVEFNGGKVAMNKGDLIRVPLAAKK